VPPRYEIRLCGRPAARGAEWFLGLDARSDGDVLLLRGELDQAALHGLLERARVLRLELLDVRRSRSEPRRVRPLRHGAGVPAEGTPR
jgi:hypothetical protein